MLLAFSGCTVAVDRTSRDAQGFQYVTSYECDWKRDSHFLIPYEHPNYECMNCVDIRAPNSPIIPYTRVHPLEWMMALGVPLVLDITLSPIAYFFDRDCRATGTERRYVGTPDEIKRQRREREKRALEERLAQSELDRQNSVVQKKLDAEAAAKRAEAADIAAMYPPLNDSPRKAQTRPDD